MASKKFWPRYGSDHSHRYIKKEGGGTIQSIWHHKASGKPGATSGDTYQKRVQMASLTIQFPNELKMQHLIDKNQNIFPFLNSAPIFL